jgi:DNA-binding response OmpR family regulator
MNSKNERILIVDDEETLCEILQYNLGNAGYQTEVAYSAEEALKRSFINLDLILLDVMLGPMSGFRFADILRNEMKIKVPIIFLTARETENDILTGFSLGADDYLSKPFSVNELIARVKAVISRYKTEKAGLPPSMRYEDLTIDTIHERLIINDEKVILGRKEFTILKLLMENRGKIFTRKEVLADVWGMSASVRERTVDVYITRLRAKLGKYGRHLKNKSGFGYFFEF